MRHARCVTDRARRTNMEDMGKDCHSVCGAMFLRNIMPVDGQLDAIPDCEIGVLSGSQVRLPGGILCFRVRQ